MHPLRLFPTAVAVLLLPCLSPAPAQETADEVARRLDYWKEQGFKPIAPPVAGVTTVPVTIGGQTYTLEIRVVSGGTRPTTEPIPTTLIGQLRAAYATDTPADPGGKEKARKALAEVYTRMVAAIASPDVRTLGHVQERLKMETNNALPPDVLPQVRKVIQDHLRTTLPGDPAGALTPADRTRIAAVFTTVAGALAQLP